MKRKRIFAFISALLTAALLCGCAADSTSEEPAGQSSGNESFRPADADGASAADARPVRQDGERFETVIMIEGMEETVQYEHARNESAGFELDFDYETLERRRGPVSESFVSRYDNPEDPWNYLELTFSAGDADTVSADVSDALTADYDTVVRESFMLECAGDCERIDASGARGAKTAPGSLQTVYIIPAGDGCIVAAVHCTFESAGGFGRRFTAMLHTLSVIDR